MIPDIRVSELNWMLSCPGARIIAQIARERGMAADEETAITLSGSMIHYRGALRLIEAGAVGAVEKPADANKWKPDSFETWIENFWVDYVLGVTPPDWAMEVETELELATPDFLLTGHIDHNSINVEATEGEINDLKTGYIPVDAADCNWQLFGYMVLMLVAYPSLQKLRLRIIQPRNNPDLGYDRVTEVEIDVGEGDPIAFLKTKIREALANPNKLCTGKQCRYCPGVLICPALKALRQQMILELTPEALAEAKEGSTDELLGRWVVDGKLLGTPIEKARAIMKERLEAKGDLTLEDGTRLILKDGLGPRKVSDVATVLDLAERIIPKQDLMQTLTFSIGKFEGLVATYLNLPKTSKKGMSAESWVDQHYGRFVTREPMKTLTVVQ